MDNMKGGTMEWLDIQKDRPEDGQRCWYWFEVSGRVFDGVHTMVDYPGHEARSDRFSGKGGFLTDEVTWWMPFVEGAECPKPPSIIRRGMCHYHPYESDDDSDDDGWGGHMRKAGRCGRIGERIPRKKSLENSIASE